ncbi:MAG: ribonuclease [Pseudomonadota bacterium]
MKRVLCSNRRVFQLAEWLIEEGIGETRALLLENSTPLGAKLLWPGELFAGQRLDVRLTTKHAGKSRGAVTTASGRELMVDHLPRGLSEGEDLTVTVTRAAIAEKGRWKRAQARASETSQNTEWLAGAKVCSNFASGVWEDIWHAAATGEVPFAGGTLVFNVTPAMTLIDIDGDDDPKALSLAAAPVIAQWLYAFGLGGNIGIDFPSIEAKADRRAVDESLGAALKDWSHERTAMNGFGFVQLVARLEGPSLLHRFTTSRVGMCARFALRVAERAEGIGPVLLLTVHPALKAKLKPEWLEELARRTGREVRIETDPGLALEAPHAQILAA